MITASHPLNKLIRFDPAYWIPEPTQSLHGLITSIYGLYPSDGVYYQTLLEYVQALNPMVKSPYAPLGKTVIRLVDVQTLNLDHLLCSDPGKVIQQLELDFRSINPIIKEVQLHLPETTREIESYRTLLGMLEHFEMANNLTGVGIGMLGNVAGSPLQKEIRQQLVLLDQYKRGTLSPQQYKAMQKHSLRSMNKTLGWTDKYLFGGKTARQVLFTKESHGMKAHRKLVHALENVRKLSKLASHTGILLTGLGIMVSCSKISNTEVAKKTEVAYEEIGGLAGGLTGGLAAGFYLVTLSNPIGWGVGLVLSTAASFGASTAGAALFNRLYQGFDDFLLLDDRALINRWCR